MKVNIKRISTNVKENAKYGAKHTRNPYNTMYNNDNISRKWYFRKGKEIAAQANREIMTF